MTTKITITDRNEIEKYFHSGHFGVLTPDNNLDDYDNAIGDYYAKLNDLGECIDSNGSEASLENIAEDGSISVDFFVYDREYERGSWEEKHFKTTGKLILDKAIYDGEEAVYNIEQFKENGGTQNG